MENRFWRGKRVLLTGHTGFKGSWLALWLNRLGAHVTGVALPPLTQPSLYALAVSRQDIHSILGDIRDPQVLPAAMQAAKPEIVFHLAAQALVRQSYRQPVETFATNVMGTVNLLESARHSPDVRAVVVITSDKCYENREWVWPYRENEPMGGWDPYSASKGCAELVTASYRRSFFGAAGAAGVASARAGNVIGGGDWSDDRLVPDIIRAFLQKDQPLIRNPDAVRPWQHVLEPLSGYLALAERLADHPREYAEAWNFGPDETGTHTVGQVVGHLAQRWPEAPGWRTGAGDQPHEANLLKLDSSKARSRLSWKPRLPMDMMLDWVADWYLAHARHADPLALTLNQIDAYERLTMKDPEPC